MATTSLSLQGAKGVKCPDVCIAACKPTAATQAYRLQNPSFPFRMVLLGAVLACINGPCKECKLMGVAKGP